MQRSQLVRRLRAVLIAVALSLMAARLSAQSVVEARVGPYYPEIDSELAGSAQPFRDTFGSESRLLLGLEYDRDVLAGEVGSLAVGVGLGYTRFSAPSLLRGGRGRRAKTESTLSILPYWLVGVARLGLFMNVYGAPFVPYAKAGLGGALWWAGDGDGAAEEQGFAGRGSAWGPQIALGGMLLLDGLDRQAASSMRTSSGIAHSYFFVEWYRSLLGRFGRNQMRVGAESWVAGLAFQF